MLRVLIMVFISVMVVRVARLMVKDVTLLLQVSLLEVHEGWASNAVTLSNEVSKSTRVIRLLRHRMIS